jgi:hypothetical protein
MVAIDELDRIENGKVIKGRKCKSSLWDRERTKAFNELYLTKEQWNAVYKMKDIILARIKMDKDGHTKDRNKAIEILRKEFKEIETLEDLQDYVKNAHHRVWSKKIISSRSVPKKIKLTNGGTKTISTLKKVEVNSYNFEPSLIDRISIKDEQNWIAAIRKLGRSLSKDKVRTTNEFKKAVIIP